mmetsp:Transcript_131338/g.238869  ORF Transcript_131338/g.238869 Transcript_131338/m.238869 type:complete len:212 (-) Transcript_131338:886-1521(-)
MCSQFPLCLQLLGCFCGFAQGMAASKGKPSTLINFRVQQAIGAYDNISLCDFLSSDLFQWQYIAHGEDLEGVLLASRLPFSRLRKQQTLNPWSSVYLLIRCPNELGDLSEPLVKQVWGHDDQRPACRDETVSVAFWNWWWCCFQSGINQANDSCRLAVSDLICENATIHGIGCACTQVELHFWAAEHTTPFCAIWICPLLFSIDSAATFPL